MCWLQCVRVCVLELSCWLFVAVSEEKRDSEKADERDLLRESSIKRKPDWLCDDVTSKAIVRFRSSSTMNMSE